MWIQLETPNLEVSDYAGNCLRFTQTVWHAPARFESAWDAWEATTLKHSITEPLPDVPVIVWFSHWGTYGNPPKNQNWGHVVTYVPGRGFLSSPGQGYGHQWFGSIAQVETYFNASFVGWSEDINGLQVAQNINTKKKGGPQVATVYFKTENGKTTYALAGDGQGKASWLETQDVALATALVAAHHISQTAVRLSPDTFALWRKNYTNA